MPFGIDRARRLGYPTAPFGFGAAMQAPYAPYDRYDPSDDEGADAARPLSTWSGGIPQAMNVDDSAPSWRSGGFTPVPMIPDVFAPWRKQAYEGIAGLLHAMRPYSNLSGMGADDPACHEEWAKAREWCAGELKKQEEGVAPARGVGYRNIEDCARGRVSAPCGGNNLADMPPEPLPERPPAKPDVRDTDSDALDDTKERDEKNTDCNEEWNAARRTCAEEFAKDPTLWNERKTGGYRNIEDCARSHVSEYCGGTPYVRPPEPRVKRYNIRPRRTR